mmetsp:Transcript_8408/g.10085  ORF Transcript_8408/g.10085 Transcript_8408/m.10085 type:complete len:253 (-) Transcript_8408:974-1732(-)
MKLFMWKLFSLISVCVSFSLTVGVTVERCHQCCEEVNSNFDGGLVDGKRPDGDLFHYRFCISRGCDHPELDCVEDYDNIHPRFNDIRGCRAGQNFLANEIVGFNPPAFLNISGSILYNCTEEELIVTEVPTVFVDPEDPDDPYNQPEGPNLVDETSSPTTSNIVDENPVPTFATTPEPTATDSSPPSGDTPILLPDEASPSVPAKNKRIFLGLIVGACAVGILYKAYTMQQQEEESMPLGSLTPEQAAHEIS